MIKAVVFDIGNVLIEWRPERVYDPILAPAARDHLFDTIGLAAMNEAIDAGAPFAATVAAFAARHPDHAAHIRLWHDRWTDMFAPAIPHSIRLLRALRQRGTPVFALSNFGDQTFDLAERMYPALTEFDRRYISGRMGVIKPDARIYEQVEADCGLPPSALLFTDDRAENIEAAAARGWQTHLFDAPETLAARLIAERLLTPEEAE
ncbi:HAD family hydrolase [Phaeovulum sp.]|uniref:HAD family hydrolase n=1 Tax=Phaeovulum sp. TaxID=2934796 RepID=UPI0039E6AD9D